MYHCSDRLKALYYWTPFYFTTLYFKTILIIRPLDLVPKSNFLCNDLYFKTTCNIRPHFLGPMGGLKIEGPLYVKLLSNCHITFQVLNRYTPLCVSTAVCIHINHYKSN